MRTKILFICTGNLNRSPTAEALLKNTENFEAKSAGVHHLSENPIKPELIKWADKIIVMNEKHDNHRTILLQMFPQAKTKPIVDLEIPDIYEKNSPELKELIKKSMREKGVT